MRQAQQIMAFARWQRTFKHSIVVNARHFGNSRAIGVDQFNGPGLRLKCAHDTIVAGSMYTENSERIMASALRECFDLLVVRLVHITTQSSGGPTSTS